MIRFAAGRICQISRWSLRCMWRVATSVARVARAHTSPDFYVASRAHHADVGGAYPGSMGLCREIYQEGVRIPPVKLMRGGSDECRCARAAAQQRAHSGGARRRPGRADRRLPHGRRAPARSLFALWTGAGQARGEPICSTIPRSLMRAFLQRVPGGRISSRGLSGWRRNQRPPGKDRGHHPPERVGPGLRPGRASKTRCATR